MAEKTDKDLRIVVFQDHLPSRSYRIQLNLLSRWVFLAWILAILSFGALGLGIRGWWIARKADPARLVELERQIEILRDAASGPDSAQSGAESLISAEGDASSVDAGKSSSVRVISDTVRGDSEYSENFKIDGSTVSLEEPILKWEGKSVIVRTALKYLKEDGGTQHGYLAVVGFSDGKVYTYPSKLFHPPFDRMIDFTRGETYSVSRYREVKATLGPFPSKKDLHGISVVILDSQFKVIIRRSLTNK